jgi:hypothetical protein
MNRASRSQPVVSSNGHTDAEPSASLADLLDRAKSLTGDDRLELEYAFRNRLHALLPEPKVIQPPTYTRDLTWAVVALETLCPRCFWNVGPTGDPPASVSAYGAEVVAPAGADWSTGERFGPSPAWAVCAALARALQLGANASVASGEADAKTGNSGMNKNDGEQS